jgi:hypothetical protein
MVTSIWVIRYGFTISVGTREVCLLQIQMDTEAPARPQTLIQRVQRVLWPEGKATGIVKLTPSHACCACVM